MILQLGVFSPASEGPDFGVIVVACIGARKITRIILNVFVRIIAVRPRIADGSSSYRYSF